MNLTKRTIEINNELHVIVTSEKNFRQAYIVNVTSLASFPIPYKFVTVPKWFDKSTDKIYDIKVSSDNKIILLKYTFSVIGIAPEVKNEKVSFKKIYEISSEYDKYDLRYPYIDLYLPFGYVLGIETLAISPDNNLAVTVFSFDRQQHTHNLPISNILVWELHTGKIIFSKILKHTKTSVGALEFINNNKILFYPDTIGLYNEPVDARWWVLQWDEHSGTVTMTMLS
jgi:WD40 repeat protein